MTSSPTPNPRQARVTLSTRKESKDELPDDQIRGFVQNIATDLDWACAQLQQEIERDLRLMSGIESRDATIKAQAEEIERLKQQLQKLEASKLMRLQRKYWSFRNSQKG